MGHRKAESQPAETVASHEFVSMPLLKLKDAPAYKQRYFEKLGAIF